MKRPRILIVTRNLPPLVGGMERLNWHIADELSRNADVRIIGPEGSAALQPPNAPVTEVPLRPLWRFLVASAWQAIRVARTWRPDIVLAGSGLTAPAALLAAHTAHAQSAVYLHGLDAAVKHFAYRMIWHPAIRRMDTVIANSSPTADLALQLRVNPDRIKVVHPGVQMPTAPQTPEALKAFRARHNLGTSARILLSVGRLTTRKGLLEFVQNALPQIVCEAPDTLLAVVGDAPANSLHATVQTRQSIQAAADAAGIGNHLRFLGIITDPIELACAYESANLHIFPVRQIEGDPEGFGMVAVEAAAHGIPTVGFATGGIVDAVADSRSGFLVPPGNYQALAQAALRALDHSTTQWSNSTKIFASDFDWPKFGSKFHVTLISKETVNSAP